MLLSLIERMLRFDPNERISTKEALQHEFYKEVWDDSLVNIVAKLKISREIPLSIEEIKVKLS